MPSGPGKRLLTLAAAERSLTAHDVRKLAAVTERVRGHAKALGLQISNPPAGDSTTRYLATGLKLVGQRVVPTRPWQARMWSLKALVVHCVRWAADDRTVNDPDHVDAESIAAGVQLSRWFGQEARRVYAVLGESDEDREQRRLIELMQRKGGQVSVRDVMRSSRLFATADDAEQALDGLVKRGTATRDPIGTTPRGGQPHVVYRLVDTVDVDTTQGTPASDEVLSASTVSTDGKHTPTDDPDEEVEWTT